MLPTTSGSSRVATSHPNWPRSSNRLASPPGARGIVQAPHSACGPDDAWFQLPRTRVGRELARSSSRPWRRSGRSAGAPPEPSDLLAGDLERVRRGPVEHHARRKRIKEQEEQRCHSGKVASLATKEGRRDYSRAESEKRDERQGGHQERQQIQVASEERHAGRQPRQCVGARQVTDPEKRYTVEAEVLSEHVEHRDEHGELDQHPDEALERVEGMHLLLAIQG